MGSFEEDRLALMGIAEAITEIKAQVGSLDFRTLNEYNEDEYARQVISAHLAQIGSAAAMLSEEFKERYGHIDWDVLISLQFAGDDEMLELDTHSEWKLIEYDLTEIGQEILDLSDQVQSDEDLERLSLNEEDLRDLKEMQEEEKASWNEENQKREDEAEQYTEEDPAAEEADDSFIDQRFNDAYIRDASGDEEEEEDEGENEEDRT